MGTLTEEISRLEKIVDVGSAVGTLGIIAVALGIFVESVPLILTAGTLFEVGYLAASGASLIHLKRSRHVYNPRLRLVEVCIPAAIVDAVYGLYFTQKYAVPGLILLGQQMIEAL